MKILMLEAAHYENVIKVASYHYTNLFSEDSCNEVLYISTPISPFHFLESKAFGNTLSRFKIWLLGGKRYKENLLGYVPFVLFPIYNKFIFKSKFIIENSLKFGLPSVLNFLKRNNFQEVDVLILSHILLGEVFDKVKAKVKIYRITDDITCFPTIPPRIKEYENKIISTADIVITTSLNLFERIKEIRPNDLYYIPNGVDFDFFQMSENIFPVEYKHIPSPRIIYVGAIDTWFDIDLVYFLTKELKNYSFVIIGPARINLNKLQECKNVYILGERNYNNIPKYLKNSQCGIIPFKNIELIQSVSPIKLYEYFSCGLPVVATASQELRKINSPALLSSTYEEFKNNIISALSITNKIKFIEFAKENSWRKRFEEINNIINKKRRNYETSSY